MNKSAIPSLVEFPQSSDAPGKDQFARYTMRILFTRIRLALRRWLVFRDAGKYKEWRVNMQSETVRLVTITTQPVSWR